MKKILALALALCLLALTCAGCAVKSDDPVIRVGAMKGPTGMGMAGLLKKDAEGTLNDAYEFQIAGSADELTPKFLQGELDVIGVPANLAAVLYARSDGACEVVAVNTLGVLYLVETGDESVTSLSELGGRTLVASGKGSTPEYVLSYLLTQNGLTPGEDVFITWKSEAAEAVAALAAGEASLALLPQPYVTSALGQVDGLKVAVDLTEAWDAAQSGGRLVTSVLLARRDFAQAHPKALARFLDGYAESVEYVNSDPADAAAVMETNGIAKAAVAEKAIPDCSLVCLTGSELRPTLEGYLGVLFDQNPDSVGGAMPGEDFYYESD